MKILLADDHPLFLDGLQNLLATRGYEIVATARNGREALAKVQEFRPDILLMDIFMPECNGLEATRLIKALIPECKIIMLTFAEDDVSLFEAIKSGASGYLLKSLHATELFNLLAGLERGEAVFSPGLADRILKEFAQNSKNGRTGSGNNLETVGGLTDRQAEVLRLVAQGKLYKEVAADLGLSERTIKYHMGRILDILHVESKAQAISYAAGKGFFDS
ncbi:MAG: response regulator transcription factor [Desulfosporosinus sp.]|nr:response regulator transcription factor [Desulfosporosinus sp.]